MDGVVYEHLTISSSHTSVSLVVSLLSQKLHCSEERTKACSAYMWKCHISLHWEILTLWNVLSFLHQRDAQNVQIEQLKTSFMLSIFNYWCKELPTKLTSLFKVSCLILLKHDLYNIWSWILPEASELFACKCLLYRMMFQNK